MEREERNRATDPFPAIGASHYNQQHKVRLPGRGGRRGRKRAADPFPAQRSLTLLPTTRCSLLTTHYSLLTVQYQLQSTACKTQSSAARLQHIVRRFCIDFLSSYASEPL